MKKHNAFEIIGTTHDDAIGECFDKVAKILGLPYPGGPAISKAAQNGNPDKYRFPHPKTDNPLDFSFSGLKTAVLRAVQKECNLPITHPSSDLKNHLTKQQVADFAASFENTATDILLEKLQIALEKHPEVQTIAFAGGVSANTTLRKKAISILETVSRNPHEDIEVSETRDGGLERTRSRELKLLFPNIAFSGDNAAMVASAAYFEIQDGTLPTDPYSLNIYPRIQIS